MRQLKPSLELINAAKDVIKYRAMAETLKPVVEKIQTELVEKIQPKDENGNLLTVKNKWMMTDEYADRFYSELDKAYKQAGFDLEPGYCPFLIAEDNERKAVRKMNNLATALIPGIKINPDKIYDMALLKKLTDLNLSYISQFIKR